jgi:uncharacterized protein (DUF736 family)
MALIGTFKLIADGSYAGEISTLTIQRKVRLVPTDSFGDKTPDLRVFAGRGEIGAAWEKTSRNGDTYFTVRLDDPSFPAPLWANLVESKQETGVHNLLWERPAPAKAEAAA